MPEKAFFSHCILTWKKVGRRKKSIRAKRWEIGRKEGKSAFVRWAIESKFEKKRAIRGKREEIHFWLQRDGGKQKRPLFLFFTCLALLFFLAAFLEIILGVQTKIRKVLCASEHFLRNVIGNPWNFSLHLDKEGDGGEGGGRAPIRLPSFPRCSTHSLCRWSLLCPKGKKQGDPTKEVGHQPEKFVSPPPPPLWPKTKGRKKQSTQSLSLSYFWSLMGSNVRIPKDEGCKNP